MSSQVYHPTGHGYLHPTIKALLANGIPSSGGSGGGESPVDLTGYVTTSALNNALSTKADIVDMVANTDLATETRFLQAPSGFTVHDLKKLYIITCTATGTNAVNVYLNFNYNNPNGGTFLIYNASATTPLRPEGDGNSAFLMAGQTQTYTPGAAFNIPVGRWMGITRTPPSTTGLGPFGPPALGSSVPVGSYTCVLLS
jgi:hypothetical protein